jgi:hypothetical protein
MENKKLKILNRLTKDGHITLEEALILLETEKEYVYIPSNNNTNPWQSIPSFPPQPYTNPCTPNVPDWTYRPDLVTYGSTTTNDFFPPVCNSISCSSMSCICKK